MWMAEHMSEQQQPCRDKREVFEEKEQFGCLVPRLE